MTMIKYGILCWPWQHAIDRLVSTLGKVHSSDHLLIPNLHIITYVTEIRTFYTLSKFIT